VNEPSNEADYAQQMDAEIRKRVGAAITPLASSKDLIGTWEMRFEGPIKVVRIYEFKNDGTVLVGDKTWKWRLHATGHACWWDDCRFAGVIFTVPVAPMPDIPGLENGTTQEEVYHAWKSADGRIILANFDASHIELFTNKTV